MSHLYLFEVEGHFAVFAVESSCLAFSLIVSVLLREKDKGLAALAQYPLEFTATFVLSLKITDIFYLLLFLNCLFVTCKAGFQHCERAN